MSDIRHLTYALQDWWRIVDEMSSFRTDRNSSDAGLLQTNEEHSIDQLEHCYQVYSCVLVQSISVHFPLMSLPVLLKCPNFHLKQHFEVHFISGEWSLLLLLHVYS